MPITEVSLVTLLVKLGVVASLARHPALISVQNDLLRRCARSDRHSASARGFR